MTHLDHTDEEARLVQLRALGAWTSRDRSRPHLVIGDFNALSPWDVEALNLPPGSQQPHVIAQMEKAGYVDAYRLHGEPGAQSFIPSAQPPMRIDYIFASRPLTDSVRSCAIWQEPAGQEASDHRPVLAEVDLPA